MSPLQAISLRLARATAAAANVPAQPAAPAPARTWKTAAFFGVQYVLALAILVYEVPRIEGAYLALALLIALNVAAELGAIDVYHSAYVSVGFVLTMALIVIFGAPGVVLAAPFEAIAGRLGQTRRIDHLALTNGARFVCIYWLAAQAYGLIAPGHPDSYHLEMIPATAVASVVCISLLIVMNAASGYVRYGRPFIATIEKNLWLEPHYLGLGLLGLSLAAAYIALGIAGIVAFMTPVVMMRLSMKQYVDKTAENVGKLTEQNQQLQAANIQIREVSDELRDSYDGTLEALVNALDARDQETKGHSIRVSRYMMDIARELGVKEGTKDWTDMQRGSLLHDVGKIGVSDNILLKPGKLTDDEWALMRKHPEIGYNMLRQVKFLEGAADIVLSHHERWDGKGYPRGLHEDEVMLGARIFNVVDTFDSMTSDRPYRKALATTEALNEILKYSGSQFDPLVVEAFLDIYETWVKQREELHKIELSQLSYKDAA